MAIDTVEGLREHLQWAIQVELSTIPTYLYAMYSIDDQDAEAYRLIRSVAVEEMLHAALAANILVAVGGQPRFYDEDVMPSYPMDLPHHDPPIWMNLERCSPEFVERVCLPIEHPKASDAVPEDDDYETIGQFYLAIEEAVKELNEDGTLFDEPQVARQLADPGYYSPVEFDDEASGGLHPVDERVGHEHGGDAQTCLHHVAPDALGERVVRETAPDEKQRHPGTEHDQSAGGDGGSLD